MLEIVAKVVTSQNYHKTGKEIKEKKSILVINLSIHIISLDNCIMYHHSLIPYRIVIHILLTPL
jgi:hypothetical protein